MTCKGLIFWSVFLSFLSIDITNAQESLFKRPSYSAFKPQFGFIIPHRETLKEVSDYNPYGLEMEYGWIMNQQKDWQNYNCYSRAGFSMLHVNYRAPDILGSSSSLIAFAEPFFNYNGWVLTSVRMGAGVSYLSKVYDAGTNPKNLFFSSPVSFLAHIDVNLTRFVSDRWFVNAYFKYNHISNGGIKKPNKGMNFPTCGLGVGYALQDVRFQKRSHQKLDKPVSVIPEAQAFVTLYNPGDQPRLADVLPSVGILVNARRKLSHINALSAGLEGVANYYYKKQIGENDRQGDHRQFSALMGHEFVFGRFAFVQYLGFYIYGPYYDEHFFQRYNLTFDIWKGVHAGVTLKAHKAVAENFNFLVGYTFGS